MAETHIREVFLRLCVAIKNLHLLPVSEAECCQRSYMNDGFSSGHVHNLQLKPCAHTHTHTHTHTPNLPVCALPLSLSLALSPPHSTPPISLSSCPLDACFSSSTSSSFHLTLDLFRVLLFLSTVSFLPSNK